MKYTQAAQKIGAEQAFPYVYQRFDRDNPSGFSLASDSGLTVREFVAAQIFAACMPECPIENRTTDMRVARASFDAADIWLQECALQRGCEPDAAPESQGQPT